VFAVVLAAVSGLSYGAADFFGALGAKRTNALLVAAGVQLVGLVALVLLDAVAVDAVHRTTDLAWGAAGGIAASMALVAFYRALASGPMSGAAALTAMVGTVLPVGVGLALGERPGMTTLAGVVACIPAAALVARGPDEPRGPADPERPDDRRAPTRPDPARTRSTRRSSIVAGVGFGLFFVCLAQVGDDAGLYPLLGARGTSVTVLGAVLVLRRGWTPRSPTSWRPVVVAGLLDCTANATYLTAVTRGQLSWVAALSSLYPVATALLARAVLGERLGRTRALGLALAATALVAIAVGR